MARHLDPKLQRILEDVSHPSATSDNFDHTPLNRHLGRRHSVRQPSLLDVGFQIGDTMSEGLGRNSLRSDNATRLLDTDVGLQQPSLPTSVIYRNPNPTKTKFPSIYGHQFAQLRPVDEGVYTRGFQSTAVGERPQHAQTVMPKSTDIFHGIVKTNTSNYEQQEPITPVNLSRFAYISPVQNTLMPSSGHEHSSPTNRISLRRMSCQKPTLTLPKVSQSDFDDELLFNATPKRQATNNIGTAARPPSFHNPPTVQGIQLVSPYDLPDRFRQVFPYELFNAVQSKCFAHIYNSTDNVVVAAPTGSGKTALLELAICKLVHDFGSEQFKIIYQAPTKSLCNERVRDWERKFSHLNLPCAELTGDTDNSEMRKVGNAAIIVTTPEKWDSITRKWKDHVKLLQLVKLVLIDEVHILKDPRGATLEAVVSRMKTIGVNVRFVALSATVPNSEDIAIWLGQNHTKEHLSARRETFGEEFRPVKLQKHVYGFSANVNDFAFDTFLDTKLPGLLMRHTIGKPVMVFCVTRKICETTAAKLADWWSNLRVTERPWPIPRQKVNVASAELRELVGCGVAFHHAGLDAQDRTAVETGFLKDGLSVICCTSTLAVGVNLPCHLVVIKNTVCYKDTGLSEYSDLDVMQMLGRAGRPQFDDSAIAIIMTRSEKAERYKLMISGQDILESTLHLNHIEHLNSEIGLGTVHDVYSAKRWLAGTFLSVRMRKNPSYYKFSSDTGSRDADERLERICERDIELLRMTKLITKGERFACTEYGQAMSKYMVHYETMKLLLSIPKSAKMTHILHIVSQSAEFKDLRVKPNERGSFREFNKSPFIKLPIKENITTYAHKVSLIIQIHLGGVELPMEKEFNKIKRQFLSEKTIIFERMLRLIRCVVECKAYECDAVATCNALELLRSIAAGFWENSTLQLRQLPTIGPAAVRKLAQSNIKTVVQLAAMDSAAIERVMSRNPPFGKKILDLVANFPRLTLKADVKKKIIKPGEQVKVQIKAQAGYSNFKYQAWNRKIPAVTFTASITNGHLAHIWRGSLKSLEKGFDLTFTCELSSSKDTVTCQLTCEEIVGTIQSVELRPEIPSSSFPPQKPIPLQTDTTSGHVPAVPILYAEEESEITAVLNEKNGVVPAAPGSDYGGDSVFDDFVDIEDDEIGPTSGNGNPESIASEPVQMENGRWRCNHKCRDAQGNYLNKNGVPCRHLCCREGLDKPRKIQKKVMESDQKTQRHRSKKSEKTVTKASKKNPKAGSNLQLRLSERVSSFQDIEELDLIDELLVVESAHNTPRKYPVMPGVHSIEGKHGSVRISKKMPKFSYTSASQPNLSLIGHFTDDDQNSPQFPLPSELLGSEDPFENAFKNDSNFLSSMLSDKEANIKIVTETDPMIGDSFDESAFDFITFEASESIAPGHKKSSSMKRAASPSSVSPQKRVCRVIDNEAVPIIVEEKKTEMVQEQIVPKTETKKQLPDWVAEIDQDLIAFFGDSVEYVE